ncbi:MAG: MotA/TolQ/ExbB proton channel family protein [Desulfurobacteriaceae bacterium]
MLFDIESAHNAIFFILYFLLFLSTTVFLERLLYFSFTFPTERKLIRKEVEGEDEKTAEIIYNSYASKLERGKGVFLFTITAAPLLGLLGTVLGIMDSFQTMADKGISDIALVSKGIAYALKATALGIAVAVITLLYYHTIVGIAKRKRTEIKKLILETLKNLS